MSFDDGLSMHYCRFCCSGSVDAIAAIVVRGALVAIFVSLFCSWTHIFVDEFQDSSILQLQLVFLLFVENLPATSNSTSEADCAEEGHRNSCAGKITIVGDPNQSIYSWRFACASIFDIFSKVCA